jgi:hypothetical protein
MKLKIFLLFLGLLSFSFAFSQDDEKPARKNKGIKGFHAGLYLGSLFANKYTAKFYDGYGYDETGKRNDFFSSFMYRRIVIDYGGGNGQHDYVADALGVQHGEWSFDQTDMPVKMKYNPAVLTGLQLDYGFTKNDAFLMNINASKLSVSGDFTIVVTNPKIGPTQPNYQDIRTFGISGGEQRLMIQLGYCRILGNTDESPINCFFEAGGILNAVKYLRNQATISTLPIDLSFYYTQPYYLTYRASYLRGTGWGAFAGFGIHLEASAKWTLQLLYSPSFEKINMGEAPKFSLQHSAGFRAFYNL